MRTAKKTSPDSKILQELVPLNALSPERFKEVSAKIVVEEVKSGRYLFRKGDRDNQSIYLLEGRVNLIDGFRKVASEVESGTDMSRYPLSNVQPRTVSARAAKKCLVARIDSSLLDAFLTWDQSNSAEAVDIAADENSDWMTRMLQSEAFMRIPPSMIQSLLMKMQSVEVEAGDTIIRQGDEGDYFYTIHDGRCAVTHRDEESGDEHLLAELREGDSFGEESLVSDTRRNATVTMLTDGMLMRLTKKDFVTLLQEPLVKRISYEEATALVEEGAVWVDVRTPDEYESGSFEDSVNIPLSTLRGEIPELVFNAKYVMCCDTGRRSGSAAFMLSHKGFDVYVLDGGIAGLEAGSDDNAGATDQQQGVEEVDTRDTGRQAAEVIDLDTGLQEIAVAAGNAAAPDLEILVGTLRTENDSLRAELEQSRSTEVRVTEQLGLLRGELGESGEKLATLYAQASTDADEKQQLREEHARLQEEYARRLKALQAEIRALRQQQQDEAAGGQEEVLQLQQDLAEARSQVEALNKDLSSARDAIENQKVEQAEAFKEQQERISGLQEALEKADREHQQLSRQLAASNEEGSSVENSLRAELQGQLARSEELELRRDELEARVASLQQELENGRQEMERQATAAAAEREALASRLEEISGQEQQESERLTGVLEENEAAGLKIQSLEQELAALRAELDAVNERAVSEKNLLEEQLHQLQMERGELQEFQQDHARQAGELQEASLQRDDLQKQLDLQVEENRGLQKELEGLREEIAALGASHDGQLRELQSGIAAGQELIAGLEQAIAEKDAQLAVFQEELSAGNAVDPAAGEQLEAQHRQLAEQERLARQLAEESQEAIRKVQEDLDRKNENEKELHVQIERLRKQLEQASLQQQQLRESSQADVDNIREELHAERQARAEERAEMAARQRELKEQLVAVASEHEANLNNQSGAIEEARDAAREEERQRMQGLLQAQQQAEDQLQKMHAELQEAHAEIARLNRQDKERRQADDDLLQERNSEAQTAIAQLEAQVRQLSDERDQLLESQQELHEQLKVMRGEVEVASGLMNAGEAGHGEDGDLLFREDDTGNDPTEALEDLELPLHVPSLDAADDGGQPADTVQVPPSNGVSVTPDVESDDVVPAIPEGAGSRRQNWLGRLLGVAMVGLSALMFWVMLGIEGGGQVTENAIDQPAAPDSKPRDATSRSGVAGQKPAALPVTPVAGRSPVPAVRPAPATADSREVARQPVAQKAAVPEPAAPARPVLAGGPGFRDNLRIGGSGPLMAELPGGSYMMGSTGNSLNFDEGPRHQVTLPGFSISKHEITFSEYDRFARDTGRRLPHDEGWGRGNRPVINVSWHDAAAYAAWLSKQTGKSYRLPTESEWEYAVRAGSEEQHWWELDSAVIPANCFDCGSQWDGSRTAPAGSFAANNFGLHDMAGNVQEWTQDCYRAGYADAPVDGSARLVPQCAQRVVRGGAYTSPLDSLRSARRGQYDQETRLDNLGFRVVRDN